MNTSNGNFTAADNMDSTNISNDTGPVQVCAEDFFFDDETQACRPVCGKFLARNVLWLRVVYSTGVILSLLLFISDSATAEDTHVSWYLW